MAASKISVIIAHEYLTRVRARWFMVATLLGPLAMAMMVAIPALAAVMAGDGAVGKVAVVDRTGGGIGTNIVAGDTALFVDAAGATEQQLAARVRSEALQAYVVIPATILDSGAIVMYSRGGSGVSFDQSISSAIEPYVVQRRLQRAGTDTSVIRLVEEGVRMHSLKITEQGVETDTSTASAAIGYGAGFVIYILIFLYGTMVMRGVVDEKANRIVEILASSARPFQIMMGKVIGIGMVGLTQMVLWLVLGAGAVMVLSSVIGGEETMRQMQQSQQNMQPIPGAASAPMMLGGIGIPAISISAILLFLFYFLCGYFIYASLFAAIGSAVDQESDANQLTFPVTLPIILTMMFIPNVVAAPNGTMAVVLSLIPLFAPIVMTVRIAATDVPLWQIAMSMTLCVAGFFGVLWLASRVYRIGILSYGRKPSLREVARWITMRV